jgi:phosphoglycolate phosphatase
MITVLPQAIVFDFDLTLVDSTPAFIECHRYAGSELGLPPPDPDAIVRTIGTPLPIAFTQIQPSADPALFETYLGHYQQHADEVMTGLTRPLDGAYDAVRRLHDAGILLAIVSQKLRYRVEDVLARDGLDKAFATIIGGDDVPELKPDPRGLLLAVERLGSRPDRAIYAGDTVIDAETARRASMPFVAVLSGATKRDDFARFQPLGVIERAAELPRLLGLDS